MTSALRLVALIVVISALSACEQPAGTPQGEADPSTAGSYQAQPVDRDYASESWSREPVAGGGGAQPMDGEQLRAYSQDLDQRLGNSSVWCDQPEPGQEVVLQDLMVAAAAEIQRIQVKEQIVDPNYYPLQRAGRSYVCAQRGLNYLRCVAYQQYQQGDPAQCRSLLAQ